MNVALDRDSKRQLKRLVPLNLLPEPDLERLAEYVRFGKLKRGDYLFRQGDTEARNVYLLSGSVALLIDGREVDTVSSDSDTARFPLAHQIPRKNSARALGRVDCVSIDSRRLSDLLANTSQETYQVQEIAPGASDDWMSQLLQSRVFQQIPAANIQSVMMRMEEIKVPAGKEIIRQGGEGDYFYLIHKGRCVVTKQLQPGAKPKELAQLGPGDSFGEEALLSGSPRGSTVTMLTNGVLLRLSKEDFIQFVKRPLAQALSYEEAAAKVAKGAIWLDVRRPEEYEAGHIDGSISLPLNTVRYQASALAADRPYIAYCDTGQQSATAAFLLIQLGYEVSVLDGGIGSAPASVVVDATRSGAGEAEVIPLPSAKEAEKEKKSSAPGAVPEANPQQLRQAEQNIRDLVARLKSLEAEGKKASEQWGREGKALMATLEKSKSQIEELEAQQRKERGAYQQLQKEAAVLKESLEKSKAQIEGLEAQQSGGRETDQKLRQESAALKEALGQAKSEVATLTEALEQAKSEMASVRQEQDVKQQELERLEQAQQHQGKAAAEEEKLRTALQALEKRAAQAAEEYEDSRHSLEEELEQLRKQLEEAAEEQGHAEATIRELRERQATLEHERNRTEGLEDKIEQLRAELEEAAATATILKQENERQAKLLADAERQQQTDSDGLQAELKLATAALEEADQAREAAEKRAKELASSLEQQEQELNGLRDALDQESRKAGQTSEQIQRLMQSLEALQAAASEEKPEGGAAELESVRAELELVRTHAMADLNALQDELRTVKAALHEREREESKKKAEQEADRQELDRLRTALEQRDKQIQRAEIERRHLEDSIEDRNAELDRLRHEVEEALVEAQEAGYGREEAEAARKQVEDALYALKSELEKESSRRETIVAKMRDSEEVSSSEPLPPPASSRRQRVRVAVAGVVLLFVLLEGALILTGKGELISQLVSMLQEPAAQLEGHAAPSLDRPGPESQGQPVGGQQQTAPAAGAATTPAPVKSAAGILLHDVSEGPAMLRISGGRFSMGSDRSQLTTDEQPVHTVVVRDFALSRDEVTFDEYDRFAHATGRRLPSDNGWGRGDRPVINVSWNDAVAYAAWLSKLTGKHYRLPSEAEWEYAAQSGTDTLYWWGYEIGKGRANCFDCGSRWDRKSTAPVGSFPPNPYGVHDMAGNVREWVQDCYHSNYRGAPTRGEAWEDERCDARVVRGGAYDKPADAMRPSWRGQLKEDVRLPMLGFRLARDL